MLSCHNCKQGLPEGSFFCNNCGSKIRSSTSKLHSNEITPILKKNPDLNTPNGKDKFPVKALILIILIVLVAGLYSVYDHYRDAQDMKAIRNKIKLYSYIREENWEGAQLFIEKTNVTNIDDIDYLSVFINARYNFEQINEDEEHNEEIFNKIDGVWYELLDYNGEFKEDINNFNIEYLNIRWKLDESVKESSSRSNFSSSTLEGDNNKKYTEKTWNKTAGSTTGYNWIRMNTAQKKDIVDGVIMDWKSNSFEVSASSSYFISALDAFYGDDSTNGNNLAEAMSMIGISGNVLNKK
ncbi:zinc ribbon domain-containing protein [Paenibacillus odorifer]|uniref:Uncharacterized protein n=1 Tax=Paenibacillus odorifer TaxID=189426 RepID=A0A1R0WSA6_9BACL|nr:zinc ribbon domain-containing protein [Paenibacillus odorifer]OMD20351.1 hypothetical protein BJP51_09720 [Paenibacillus odorifer]OMD57643.1 hypothetical protein BSK48_30870 [Paenibacillus odorifer]